MAKYSVKMMKKLLLASAFLVLGGCASTSSSTTTDGTGFSDTMEIIRTASAQAPAVVTGDYTLFVKAIGQKRGAVFLNTELDYRDQRNVTIVVPKWMLPKMGIENFHAIEAKFLHQAIRVHGDAMRTKIYLMNGDEPSDTYYYQTHIEPAKPADINVVTDK